MSDRELAVISAKWFVDFMSLPFLLDACHLDTADGDWHVWRDEAGNVLRLTTDHKIRIFPSNEREKTTSDIYRYATPAEVAGHSYWALLYGDQKEQTILLLGTDERLRLVRYDGSKYATDVPLRAGVRALRAAAELVNTTSTRTDNEKVLIATSWPPETPLHDVVDKTVEGLLEQYGR